MLPQERYRLLMQYLQEHEIIKIDEMAELFDISIETARRDLNYLEKEGSIKKIYGGAALVPAVPHLSVKKRKSLPLQNVSQKIWQKRLQSGKNAPSLYMTATLSCWRWAQHFCRWQRL